MAELDEVATLTVQGESAGVDQVVTSLNAVSDAQTRVGETAAASATVQESAATKQLSAAAAYDKLRASIDSSYASQVRFGQGVSTLDKAFSQGLINEASYAAQMENLHAKYSGVVQDSADVGGSLGFLNGMFAQHTAEVGRSSEAVNEFGHAAHAAKVPLAEMGIAVGGLREYTAAARGGILLFTAAIGGALVAALEMASDKAQVATDRLTTLLSSTSSGQQSFAALGDIALKTGTDVGVLATSYESLLRTMTGPTNMVTAGGAVGLGAGPQKTIQDALAAIAEDLKIGGANATQSQQAFASLFDTIQKGGLVSVQTIEKLDAISPKLAQDLATALGQGVGQQAVQKLGELAAQGQVTAADIINAFAGIRPQIDAQFAGWTPTLGQAVDKLKTSFEDLMTEIAKGSGFKDLAGFVDGLSRSLEELAKHPDPLVTQFQNVKSVFKEVGGVFKDTAGYADDLVKKMEALQNQKGWSQIIGDMLGIPASPEGGGLNRFLDQPAAPFSQSPLGQTFGGAPSPLASDPTAPIVDAVTASGATVAGAVTTSASSTTAAVVQSNAVSTQQIIGGINMLPPGMDGIAGNVHDMTTTTAGALASGQQADTAGHAATRSAVDSAGSNITAAISAEATSLNGALSGIQTSVQQQSTIFDQIGQDMSNWSNVAGPQGSSGGKLTLPVGGDNPYPVGTVSHDTWNRIMTGPQPGQIGGPVKYSPGLAFQNAGADVMIGGSGAPDSVFLPLYVSPGERLIVLPAGQTGLLQPTGLPSSLNDGGFAQAAGTTAAVASSGGTIGGGAPVFGFGGPTGQTYPGSGVAPISAHAPIVLPGLAGPSAPAMPPAAAPLPPSHWDLRNGPLPATGPTAQGHWTGIGAGTDYFWQSGPGPYVNYAANGLDYVIPGSGAPDSVSMPLHVSPGERLIVLPAGQAGLVPDLGLPGLHGAPAGGVFAANGLDTGARALGGGGSSRLDRIEAALEKLATGQAPLIGTVNVTAQDSRGVAASARQSFSELARQVAARAARP